MSIGPRPSESQTDDPEHRSVGAATDAWIGVVVSDSRQLAGVASEVGGRVLNLSVPDLFLFWLCSAKYSTALHNIFNIFEKVQKIQYLTQRRAAKIQYVRTYEKKKKVEQN